jgi:hypothetical protein
MRDICRFLRIDIQAPASLPISLIRNTDETITLLVRMARFIGHTRSQTLSRWREINHGEPPGPIRRTKAG